MEFTLLDDYTPTVKTTDLQKLAEDAYHCRGWENLKKQAENALKYLREWKVPIESKTGKTIWIRYPKLQLRLKSKMGRLDTTVFPNEEEMATIKKRVKPEAFQKFKELLSGISQGILLTIEGMSKTTCQATGQPGAKQIVESGGWIRTLLPSVAKKLKLKEKPLHSYILS